MKRTLITFFVTVATLFAATPYAVAYDCEVDGIYYSRISATEVEVTNKVFSDQNHAAYTGTINIPAIKSFAFFNCSSMTSVNMPASVQEIGMGAFEGCSSLTQMVLPKGILVIENETFFGCKSLKGVVIPASVTNIGEEAFSRCTSLISIYCLAKTAPECEPNAFSKVDRTWCTVYVPSNIKSYKDNAMWREFFIEEYTEKSDDIKLDVPTSSN